VAAFLCLAFAGLGTLQYHWLREVAEAQRERLRTDAAARATAVAADFDRELTRAFVLLPLDADTVRSRDASRYAAQHREWQAQARWPSLVAGVYAFERAASGATLLRFVPATSRLEPVAWPADLEGLRAPLETGTGVMEPVQAGLPGLVVPMAETMPVADLPKPDLGLAVRHVLIRRGPLEAPRRWTIVLFDRAVFSGRVWPELLAARLGAAGTAEYEGAIVDAHGGAALHGTAAGAADAQADLLRLRFDDLDRAILSSFLPDALRHAGRHDRVSVRFFERLASGDAPEPAAGRWRVVLRHRRGSVDRAVSAVLARNLAVAFGVQLVLVAGVALIAVSARRARRLAERQMEFVGAVSHELRTPLAIIRSAGENLADGVVADASHVRRYGTIVRDEGERLSSMVEQVLGFAGADATAREAAPVDVRRVVERAIEKELQGATGIRVEADLPAAVPAVLGDEGALDRAVANLVANARKHGGEGGYVGVRVRVLPEEAPRLVAITVTDHGPGVEAGDRPRLFEAFFRGRRARDEQKPGSGLGLAVVRRVAESHGGRVELAAAPGPGAAFTLILPAAPVPSPARGSTPATASHA
jgi:signal transduction histidine kinase